MNHYKVTVEKKYVQELHIVARSEYEARQYARKHPAVMEIISVEPAPDGWKMETP